MLAKLCLCYLSILEDASDVMKYQFILNNSELLVACHPTFFFLDFFLLLSLLEGVSLYKQTPGGELLVEGKTMVPATRSWAGWWMACFWYHCDLPSVQIVF